MKFLAVDSSLRNTGVAIGRIEGDEVFVDKIILNTNEKTKNKQVRASSDTIDACRQNFQFLQKVIEEYKPQVIMAETPSGSQSSSGMKSYGATCQLIGSLTPAPIEVTPNEVKMASVGSKTASKKEMIEWAHRLYPDLEWYWHAGKLQNKNEHMADGIAIAFAAKKTRQFDQLRALLQ